MNTKRLLLGAFLLITFGVVLVLIFMPIYGDGKNGLQFSDDFFNSLAKGSSNYMEDMRRLAQKFQGVPLTGEIDLGKADKAQKAQILFSQAGAQVESKDSRLSFNGDLGKIFLAAIADAEALFHNQPEQVQARYNINGREAVRLWWESFNKLSEVLTKQKAFKEAKAVSDVQKRALEPGYNFYGIKPKSVRDHVGMLTFMLVFYVLYTLWYGYAIYELFEGMGLGTGKPIAKKEV